jgi:hypothetical protein
VVSHFPAKNLQVQILLRQLCALHSIPVPSECLKMASPVQPSSASDLSSGIDGATTFSLSTMVYKLFVYQQFVYKLFVYQQLVKK